MYHTSVVNSIAPSVTISDRLNVVIARKALFSPKFYALLHDAISNSFSVVNVSSILSLSQMKMVSISNGFEQLYLGRQFASVSSLRGIS